MAGQLEVVAWYLPVPPAPFYLVVSQIPERIDYGGGIGHEYLHKHAVDDLTSEVVDHLSAHLDGVVRLLVCPGTDGAEQKK